MLTPVRQAVSKAIAGREGVQWRSQCGEDFLAWSLSGFRCDGIFVEVGAYDGLGFSNSAALEQLGWRGLLIEANPSAAEDCRRNRPLATVIHAAAGGPGSSGTIPFCVVEGTSRKGVEMLSHVVSAGDEAHRARIAAEGGTSMRTHVVIKPLAEILRDAGFAECPIEVLSIDIEGAELDAMVSVMSAGIKPAVLIVEGTEPQLQELLSRHGYTMVCEQGSNRVFQYAQN
jgi:FkbM family methyltransferase